MWDTIALVQTSSAKCMETQMTALPQGGESDIVLQGGLRGATTEAHGKYHDSAVGAG